MGSEMCIRDSVSSARAVGQHVVPDSTSSQVTPQSLKDMVESMSGEFARRARVLAETKAALGDVVERSALLRPVTDASADTDEQIPRAVGAAIDCALAEASKWRAAALEAARLVAPSTAVSDEGVSAQAVLEQARAAVRDQQKQLQGLQRVAREVCRQAGQQASTSATADACTSDELQRATDALAQRERQWSESSVSYTHLTLPTIYSV